MIEPVPEMRTTMRDGASGCVTVRPYLQEEVLTVTTAREPLPTVPERLRLYCHLFAAAMFLTWILNNVPYPARFAVIGTAGAAVIFAALAMWATVGQPRMMFMRLVLGVAGVIAMLTAVSSFAYLLIADELIALSTCEQRALTPMALEACQDEFLTAVEGRLGVTLPR